MKPTTPRAARAGGSCATRRTGRAGGAAAAGRAPPRCARRRLGAAARGRRARRACGLAGAERHRLDEAHVPRALERERGERHDVVLVEAAHDDGVQLDRREARPPRRPRCPPRCRRAMPQRMTRATRSGSRVSRWTFTRRRPARARARARAAAAGCRWSSWRGRATPGIAREPVDDLDQVGAQRRLAAGQAELPEADRDRGARHLLDLRRR